MKCHQQKCNHHKDRKKYIQIYKDRKKKETNHKKTDDPSQEGLPAVPTPELGGEVGYPELEGGFPALPDKC